MARVVGAHHMGLHVQDLARSVAFYRDLLGFEMVFQWNPQAEYIRTMVGYPTADVHSAILKFPGSEVYLELLDYRGVDRRQVDTSNANPGTAHIAVFVDELDELFKKLTSEGVESVSNPVTPTMGPNEGGRAVYMIDPDGFRVELIQSTRTFGSFADGRR